MDLLGASGSSWKHVSSIVNFCMFAQTGCGFVAQCARWLEASWRFSALCWVIAVQKTTPLMGQKFLSVWLREPWSEFSYFMWDDFANTFAHKASQQFSLAERISPKNWIRFWHGPCWNVYLSYVFSWRAHFNDLVCRELNIKYVHDLE